MSNQIKDLMERYSMWMDHPEHFEHVIAKFEQCILSSSCPAIEVGTNKGGSTMCFAMVLAEHNKKNWLIGVDPYGSLPYHNGVHTMQEQYTNINHRGTMCYLYGNIYTRTNFTHFKLKSLDFAACYDNIKLYTAGEEEKLDKLSFVYLDGSHDPEIVKKEVKFFSQKLDTSGGTIIIDDYVEDRFVGFWEEFFKENPQFCRNKTTIPSKTVVEYR